MSGNNYPCLITFVSGNYTWVHPDQWRNCEALADRVNYAFNVRKAAEFTLCFSKSEVNHVE